MVQTKYSVKGEWLVKTPQIKISKEIENILTTSWKMYISQVAKLFFK